MATLLANDPTSHLRKKVGCCRCFVGKEEKTGNRKEVKQQQQQQKEL